jgi:hypothetical protein
MLQVGATGIEGGRRRRRKRKREDLQGEIYVKTEEILLVSNLFITEFVT